MFAQTLFIMFNNQIDAAKAAGYELSNAVINSIHIYCDGDEKPFVKATTTCGSVSLPINKAEKINENIRDVITKYIAAKRLYWETSSNKEDAKKRRDSIEVHNLDDAKLWEFFADKVTSLTEKTNEYEEAIQSLSNHKCNIDCVYGIRHTVAGERRISLVTGEEYGNALTEDKTDRLLIIGEKLLAE